MSKEELRQAIHDFEAGTGGGKAVNVAISSMKIVIGLIEAVEAFESKADENAMRKCDICNKPMTEGFVIHDGEEYYCSGKCLHGVYTNDEYMQMYANDEAYWTEWEDD